MTYGGYSQRIVADESFVLHVPESLDITGNRASSLCRHNYLFSSHSLVRSEKNESGVVGLGGLGHMGVKFSHALGAHTVMITTTPEKGEDAKTLGADEILISTDSDQMAKQAGEFDFILNTIPVDHEVAPYLDLLKVV